MDAPLALCIPDTLTFQFLSFTLLPPATGHWLLLFLLASHSTPANTLLSSLSSSISPERQFPSSMHLHGTMFMPLWLPSQCNPQSLMESVEPRRLSIYTADAEGRNCFWLTTWFASIEERACLAQKKHLLRICSFHLLNILCEG